MAYGWQYLHLLNANSNFSIPFCLRFDFSFFPFFFSYATRFKVLSLVTYTVQSWPAGIANGKLPFFLIYFSYLYIYIYHIFFYLRGNRSGTHFLIINSGRKISGKVNMQGHTISREEEGWDYYTGTSKHSNTICACKLSAVQSHTHSPNDVSGTPRPI